MIRLKRLILLTLLYFSITLKGQLDELGIKYTREGSEFDETDKKISTLVVGNLVSDLQQPMQQAFDELENSPKDVEAILLSLTQEMASDIADVIIDIHQQDQSNYLEEAAQISGAVRTALEASQTGRSTNLLSQMEIIMLMNELVGELESIFQITDSSTQVEELVIRIQFVLQTLFYQAFGITSNLIIVPSTLEIPSPTAVPSPKPPSPAPAQATATNGPPSQKFVYTSFGSRVLVGGCFDIVPPGGFTCEEQNRLGKCARGWMLEGSFCAQTCNYCDDECIDIQPDILISCQEYKDGGLCDSELLTSSNYCKKTCNRCGNGGGGSSSSIGTQISQSPLQPQVSPPPVPSQQTSQECFDVPTNDQYSCAQQKQFGKCSSQWMIQGGYCALTCGRCGSLQTTEIQNQDQISSGQCSDIPPDNKHTCEQQKQFGKCEAIWLVSGGFCRRTCGRCDASLSDIQNTQSQQQIDDQQQQCSCDCENQAPSSGLQNEAVAQLLVDAIEKVLEDLSL